MTHTSSLGYSAKSAIEEIVREELGKGLRPVHQADKDLLQAFKDMAAEMAALRREVAELRRELNPELDKPKLKIAGQSGP